MFLRVDDRLLHGQVAVAWTSKLQANFIVIANDSAATDAVKKMSIKLAKPAGADLRILTMEDGIKILNDERILNKHAIVIAESIADAYRLVEESPYITQINIGGLRQSKEVDKVQIDRQIFLNKEEIEYLEKLSAKGLEVFGQVGTLDNRFYLEHMKKEVLKGGK
ncbi:MAG: PTS sugar transporter subunit IIB [Erysipelotrichaceae bacterium]